MCLKTRSIQVYTVCYGGILLAFRECVDNVAAAGGPFIKFESTIASISCVIDCQRAHSHTHTHTHI